MARQRTRPIAGTVGVNSLQEFMGAIKLAQSELSTRNLWFRGHASERWLLQPSIYRSLKPFMHDNIKRWAHERTLYVKFQSAAYSRARNLPDQNDVSKWLCLMRHYGLSTRLLDWTTSPLVACYFALAESPLKTPTIWAINPDVLNGYFKSIAPTLILRDSTPDARLNMHLKNVLEDGEQEDSVLAVEPPEIDNRLLAQKARFTIHGVPTELQKFKIDRSYLHKIRLTNTGAKELRNALKLFGYKESVMFPDLDHLALELADAYKYRL